MVNVGTTSKRIRTLLLNLVVGICTNILWLSIVQQKQACEFIILDAAVTAFQQPQPRFTRNNWLITTVTTSESKSLLPRRKLPTRVTLFIQNPRQQIFQPHETSLNVSRNCPQQTSMTTSALTQVSGLTSFFVSIMFVMNVYPALAGDLNTATATSNSGRLEVNSNVPTRIRPCDTSANSNTNCVSTASVKQVDKFMLPWTWPESISGTEIISRFKGIIASDQTLSWIQQDQDLVSDPTSISTTTTTSTTTGQGAIAFLRFRAARNVCTDEIEILINSNDRIITFRSQQIEGPENISDFGSNRHRLEDIRKKLKVVTILGSNGNDSINDNNNNNNESSEGLSGQLKAFWGFQSGGGFESILLDEDE
jgi:uncharacterized protein (DUF1499 family)